MSRISNGHLEKVSDVFREKQWNRNFIQSDDFRFYLLRKKWKNIVGEKMAQESYLAGFRNHTIYVQVTNSAWLQHMTMFRSEILSKIREDDFGKNFDDIRFRIGPVETKNQPKSTVDGINRDIKKRKAILSTPLSSDEKNWITGWVDGHVTDDRLKPLFNKMMSGALKKRKGELASGWHICPYCGATVPPEEKLCPECERKASVKRRNQAIAVLKQYPHYNYQMVKNIIPVSYEEYNEAHDFLRIRYEEQIYHRFDVEENKKRLLALLIHKPVKEITKEEIEEKLPKMKTSKY